MLVLDRSIESVVNLGHVEQTDGTAHDTVTARSPPHRPDTHWVYSQAFLYPVYTKQPLVKPVVQPV